MDQEIRIFILKAMIITMTWLITLIFTYLQISATRARKQRFVRGRRGGLSPIWFVMFIIMMIFSTYIIASAQEEPVTPPPWPPGQLTERLYLPEIAAPNSFEVGDREILEKEYGLVP